MSKNAVPETVEFELGEMVGHLIRVSQQVHYSLWSSAAGVEGLTSPQFAVLHALAHHGPMDQTALGEKASLDRTTLASIVTRLAKRGLVKRTRDKDDARRNLIEMTDAGRSTYRVAARGAFDINEKFLLSVPKRDRQTLIRVLTGIIKAHRDDFESH